SSEQLARADVARQSVEQASDSNDETTRQALSDLESARRKTSEAIAEQAAAMGRHAEAEAQKLADNIADAIEKQNDAEEAAADLMRGRTSNPLTASSLEQEVAEQSAQLASQSPVAVSKPLEQAAKAAAE